MEVLEEAIQAAALEADFTFPDDVSSSNGDQSMVIDDIIESLESDALEAEQEALAVRQAEEEAQVCSAAFNPPTHTLVCINLTTDASMLLLASCVLRCLILH